MDSRCFQLMVGWCVGWSIDVDLRETSVETTRAIHRSLSFARSLPIHKQATLPQQHSPTIHTEPFEEASSERDSSTRR